jgi:hypothetical protein
VDLPAGARLLVYPPDDPAAARQFDRNLASGERQVWTPVWVADELVVELVVARADRALVSLELASVGRGYRFFGEDQALKSGACNVDVICPLGDEWRDEISTVGLVQRNGNLLCTGFMVNNTAADGRPLLMTAFHCGIDAAAAPTLVVYWNYQSPVCGQRGGGNLTQTTSGSTLVATYLTSDFTLVELDEAPAPAYGVTFAGWNRGSGNPAGAVCIHHPSSDEKSISVDNDTLTTTFYLSPAPNLESGHHLRVAAWDVGTTESGSSGSPLFDLQHRVIGQLHGGYAACANNLADWFGRFSVSWEGGGTAETRLRDHLDPGGAGVLTLDLYDPQARSIAVTPLTGSTGTGVQGGPFTVGGNVFTVVNNGVGEASYTVSTEADWVRVEPGSGTLLEGGQVEVTALLTAAAERLPLGIHRAAIDFVNLDGGGSTIREVVLTVAENSVSLLGVAPNPVSTPPVTVRYTLRGPATVRAEIHDLRGQLVQSLGPFAGDPGPNTIAWDFRDAHGARVAAGLYIVALKSLNQTLRTTVTIVP